MGKSSRGKLPAVTYVALFDFEAHEALLKGLSPHDQDDIKRELPDWVECTKRGAYRNLLSYTVWIVIKGWPAWPIGKKTQKEVDALFEALEKDA